MGRSILTQRQQLFVEAILRGDSATSAAISAGYSAKAARTQGPRLLQNDAVADEIQSRRAVLTKKTDTLQARIIAELEKIAFANLADFVRIDEDGEAHLDLSNATREQLAVLNKIETKTRKIYTSRGEHIATEHQVKINKEDKLRGLQLLGQTVGMFKPEEVKVTVDVADRLLAARQRLQALSPPNTDP